MYAYTMFQLKVWCILWHIKLFIEPYIFYSSSRPQNCVTKYMHVAFHLSRHTVYLPSISV